MHDAPIYILMEYRDNILFSFNDLLMLSRPIGLENRSTIIYKIIRLLYINYVSEYVPFIRRYITYNYIS